MTDQNVRRPDRQQTFDERRTNQTDGRTVEQEDTTIPTECTYTFDKLTKCFCHSCNLRKLNIIEIPDSVYIVQGLKKLHDKIFKKKQDD